MEQLKITLSNESLTIELSKERHKECGFYILEVLRSNGTEGIAYFDSKTCKWLIKATGDNEHLYSCLMQIQDESYNDYFTIE